jgi:hypothetical protein
MKRLVLASVLVLALPTAALAKGPSAGTITGPGLEGSISIKGDAENGSGSLFERLVQATGFFPATFREQPDPMLQKQPKSSLGQRYTITWILPTPNRKSTLTQDLYPYATPYPLTYMRPGQPVFEGMQAYGGWYVGDPTMKEALVAAGMPAKPPSGGGQSGLSAPVLAGIVLAPLAAFGFAVVAARRRRR